MKVFTTSNARGGDRIPHCADLLHVFAKPASLSWDEAAALPMAGLIAWRAVVTRGEVRAGQRVLVTGASGGVATSAEIGEVPVRLLFWRQLDVRGSSMGSPRSSRRCSPTWRRLPGGR